MNVHDTVKRMLMVYPSVTINALDAYDHLFCIIGNGYEWQNGELVEISDIPLSVPMLSEALDIAMQFKMLDNSYSLFESTQEIYKMRHDGKEDMKGIIESFSKKMYNMLKESVSLICRTEERLNDFDVPTLERYPEIFMKNYEFRLYGLCECSELCNLPDDIKPDWLDAAERMLNFIKTHPETWRKDYEEEYNKWIPKIEARIEELKNK